MCHFSSISCLPRQSSPWGRTTLPPPPGLNLLDPTRSPLNTRSKSHNGQVDRHLQEGRGARNLGYCQLVWLHRGTQGRAPHAKDKGLSAQAAEPQWPEGSWCRKLRGSQPWGLGTQVAPRESEDLHEVWVRYMSLYNLSFALYVFEIDNIKKWMVTKK